MGNLYPTELDGDFDIGYINRKGFESYGMHRHRYCELLFVIDGDLNFLVEDKAYHSTGSCIIFFRENRLHTTDINENVNYERYNLYFRSKYVSEIVPFGLIREVYDNDCLVIPLSDDEKYGLLHYFKEMYTLNKAAETNDVEKSIVLHLLCTVLLKSALLIKKKFNTQTSRIDSYISDVLEYINSNISSKLIIEEIADVFFVSRAKLINDFKNATGVTIGDYILTRRLRLAKTLIKSGLKIGDVAEQSGFTNACHFIRTFKKETGITPLQYRNNHI